MTRVGTSFDEYPATAAHAAVYHGATTSDAETVTVNGVVFEFDADGSSAGITAGNIWVDNTGDEGVEATALAAAINATTNVLIADLITAVVDTTNDVVWLYADTPGSAGNAFTLAETSALTISTANPGVFSGGQDRGTAGTYVFRHIMTATEATAGVLQFVTPMASIIEISIKHYVGGAMTDVLSDAVVATSTGTLTLTEGSSPAWTAADVLEITIKGVELART